MDCATFRSCNIQRQDVLSNEKATALATLPLDRWSWVQAELCDLDKMPLVPHLVCCTCFVCCHSVGLIVCCVVRSVRRSLERPAAPSSVSPVRTKMGNLQIAARLRGVFVAGAFQETPCECCFEDVFSVPAPLANPCFMPSSA